MFIPDKKVDPIAFRGAITTTKDRPKIINSRDKNISVSKLVVDNISAAMFAEKQNILGARVLLPISIIDETSFKKWDVRYETYIMDVKKSLNSINTLVLKDGFENYYDIVWMIGNAKQEKKIYENILWFWQNSVFNERASLHTSTTMALYRASLVKKQAVITALNMIYHGQKKNGLISGDKPRDFDEWVEFSRKLRANRPDEGLILPP